MAPGLFNFLVPLCIGLWGLTAAYSAWALFIIVATVLYAAFAVDAFYFQLVRREIHPERAKEIAVDLGQDVHPTDGAESSLKTSASNPLTWSLVFLYAVSFGGGFTALTAWFPTYWALFHGQSLIAAGALAAIFTVYGSLIRIPGGTLSDRFGGERVAIASFSVMLLGAAILAVAVAAGPAFLGMMVLGTGMGLANAAIFELVPVYVPEAIGGASGWIGGIGGGGTLLIVPALGMFVDAYGSIGYARGFLLFVTLSAVCVLVSAGLWRYAPAR